MAVTLSVVEDFVRRDHGLAVASVVLSDGTPVSSLVNAGVVTHPVTGARCGAFVARGNAKKVTHLRVAPHAALAWRDGWRWVSLAGPVELIGPDDRSAGLDAEATRLLLREVFTSAGGAHDDWETFDRVMLEERRLAVLVAPQRLTGNP